MGYINNISDTLFADVSYFQAPVDDSYLDAGYRVLSIRSNDGDFQDPNFAHNYAWMRAKLDSGELVVGIVYCYCRPDWQATAQTMISMIEANGGLHPRVVLMLDVESGGNPGGDGSDWINRTYWALADWIGGVPAGTPNPRIIGYANMGDLVTLWRTRPDGIRLIGAGYGTNPNLPGQIAHQYTDGQGYGADSGLPDGAPPFGPCDMNSADGLSVGAFASAVGLGVSVPVPLPPSPTPPPVLSPPLGPTDWTLPTDDSIYSAASVIVAQFLGSANAS